MNRFAGVDAQAAQQASGILHFGPLSLLYGHRCNTHTNTHKYGALLPSFACFLRSSAFPLNELSFLGQSHPTLDTGIPACVYLSVCIVPETLVELTFWVVKRPERVCV